MTHHLTRDKYEAQVDIQLYYSMYKKKSINDIKRKARYE